MTDFNENGTAGGGTVEDHEGLYTETVVEYVDNSRQRLLLSVLLVILFLLLIAVSYAVIRLLPGGPISEPVDNAPEGLEWVRSIYGWGDGPEEALVAPTDVAVASDGTIWTISQHSDIVAFAPDGSPKRVISPENAVSIEGIDVGDDGNIYVTDFGGQVLAFSPDGAQVDQWNVELPNEIHVRDNKIAIAAAKGIAVFTPEGEMLFQLGGTRGWMEDQFDLPHGIVQDDAGNVYVSDTQNRRVKAYSADGRRLWISGTAPDRTQPGVADVRSQDSSVGAGPFILPSGMTLDANGRLVLVDPFKFRIAILDPATGDVMHETKDDGSEGRQTYYGEYGQKDGFFAYPTGIDYDETRDWFVVADTYNNRLQIVRLPGSGGGAIERVVGTYRPPMLICCIPWILLVIALIVAVARRRRPVETQVTGATEVEPIG